MSKKSELKDIVAAIKKIALAPPPPQAGYKVDRGGGGGAVPVPRPGGGAVGGGGGYSNPAVKAMQVAIRDLAQTISSTIDYDSLIKTMEGPPAPQGQPVDKGQETQFKSEYGKDFFSNFMVNQYLKKSDVHGVEYDVDPKRSKMLDKKPSDLKAMYLVLDSLKRIGSERLESQADGNWGPRTNNALKNVAAIADAVMKLGNDLGMQSNAFDASKIADLDSMIPENDTDISPEEKAKRAPAIANILKGVKALFLDFKQQVFMDPTYRNFIEGKTDMFTAGPHEDKGVSASEGEKPILADLQQNGFQSRFANHPAAQFQITLPKEMIPQQYQNVAIKPFTINGGDLASPRFFDFWVQKNSVLAAIKQQNPESWNGVVDNILKQVSAQVAQKLGSAQQQQGA